LLADDYLMNTPWIELAQYQDQDNQAGLGFRDYVWQAMFACQVRIPAHEEWVKLKWGFNASALFDETLERQRLFVESQYVIRNELRTEEPDHRTLALRFIQRPGEGLMLTVLGKIHGRTDVEALDGATAFHRELHSTFPYDYSLISACTGQEYLQISGQDIMQGSEGASHLAQIRRVEIPVIPDRRSPCVQGLWQTSARSHEPIWRSLASSPTPLLLNVLLRSTILYERELLNLLKNAREITDIDEGLVNDRTLAAIQQWNAAYTERRLTPWKKFFYLQVHLASSGKIDPNLFRILGTSLTLDNDKQYLPGYQVIAPRPDEEASWRKKLTNLDLMFSNSRLVNPRLADVADVEEVLAVMRIPYSPPENGLPGVRFVTTEKVPLSPREDDIHTAV
jgi:hypothetical protein